MIIPIGFLFFGGLGTWWLVIGYEDSAVIALVVAALGPISVIAYYSLAYIAHRRAIRSVVSLPVDTDTALRLTADAFRLILADGQPQVNETKQVVVAVIKKPTWTSAGEQLIGFIRSDDEGSVVEVIRDTGPQIVGRAQGRTLVETVVSQLESIGQHGQA